MSEINYEQIIGENIKSERIAKGLSQTELGNRCQIANTVISAYENGKKIPGLNTIARIARGLDVSIDQLCYGDESESFINSAPDDGRKIVNCIYVLWGMGVIYYYENFQYGGMPVDMGMSGKPNGMFLGIKEYSVPIRRLINSLNEFGQKMDTFSDPETYLESILSSVANEINSEIEKEKEREKQEGEKNNSKSKTIAGN